ncbi:hypothetical protein [Helicobacter fennelliae]|uniref:hypothetical protein n=1 Tax=Helicobacter fennelliae TaxID=215 RepID=UPI0015EB6A04|nr:hypothetical protein [Helicobacter fennelliae]
MRTIGRSNLESKTCRMDCHSPKGLCDDDKNDIKLESMQTEVSVKNLNFESYRI